MKPTLRWSEYQQLELIPPSVRQYPSWHHYLQQLFQQAITRLFPDPIEIWLTPSESGICWNAIDHQTGRSILQVSENELRVWIEKRHLH